MEPELIAGIPPEVTASTSDGTTHDGNHANEQITLTGTVSDAMHVTPPEPNNTVSCQIQITDPNAVTWGPYAMVLDIPPGDNPIEDFSYVWSFPNGAPEGVYFYQMRGTDTGGANLTWDTNGYSFTITDTIDPTVNYILPTPPAGPPIPTRYTGMNIPIRVSYEDFTDVDGLLAGITPENYRLAYMNDFDGIWNWATLNNVSFAWGSYNNQLEASFIYPVGQEGLVTYRVFVNSSAAGDGAVITPDRQVLLIEATGTPMDPYPIYGYTYLYDGTPALGYVPLLQPGCTVTVDWYNNTISAWDTITTTSDAGAQYSVDLVNYTDGGLVYCNVTANPSIYGNLGYNWSTVDIAGAGAGGNWTNIVCGVPYNVSIIQPIMFATQIPGAPFIIDYEILDRNDVRAQGYFTYPVLSPDRGFVNITAGILPPSIPPYSYAAPADQIFDGTTTTNGFFTGLMTLYFPGGPWYINVSEGGQIWPDTFYLTDWGIAGEFYIDPVGLIPGWLKDWDNITINLQVGGFDWLLSTGWNLVSQPQNASFRTGGNLDFFDSEDALNWTNLYLISTFGVADPGLVMADRLGGNPSTYALYDLDTGPGWAVDCIHGYWVYLSIAGSYVIHFDSTNATTTGISPPTQDAAIAGGWNLMGFQHNYTHVAGWAVIPTASMFTDGTVDLSGFLDHADIPPGARTKLVITMWSQAKWYNSYVVDTGFPGMISKNWAWDFSYSQNPGNGLWIWSDAGGVMTYSTVF